LWDEREEKESKIKELKIKICGWALVDYMPVICATQEAEIRRIEVQSQLGQIV
jgi:hypothetical protein